MCTWRPGRVSHARKSRYYDPKTVYHVSPWGLGLLGWLHKAYSLWKSESAPRYGRQRDGALLRGLGATQSYESTQLQPQKPWRRRRMLRSSGEALPGGPTTKPRRPARRVQRGLTREYKA
jgi:hypothetical protein